MGLKIKAVLPRTDTAHVPAHTHILRIFFGLSSVCVWHSLTRLCPHVEKTYPYSSIYTLTQTHAHMCYCCCCCCVIHNLVFAKLYVPFARTADERMKHTCLIWRFLQMDPQSHTIHCTLLCHAMMCCAWLCYTFRCCAYVSSSPPGASDRTWWANMSTLG